MISSRRLAREWALKILYQKDVGKVPMQEALDTALERLRLEFVQRGSRTASGSTAEQISLDIFTADLRDILPGLNRGMERALAAVTSRLLNEAPYWQEQRIDRLFREPASALPNTVKRMLNRAVAGVFGLTEAETLQLPALQPPRLLARLPETAILPLPGQTSDPLSALLMQLTPEEQARLQRFVMQAREELPARLEAEFRVTGVAFVHNLAVHRPSGVSSGELQAYLQTQRETFNRAQAERWRKVGAMVEKQTGDWLRTAAFAARLVRGVAERQREIDVAITALSEGWRMDRQAAVDRNILRLGGFEMLYLESVPTAVSINEAVELAKKYSTTESGRFVNGVLGALALQVGNKADGYAQAAAETGDHDDSDDLLDITIDEEDSEENSEAERDEESPEVGMEETDALDDVVSTESLTAREEEQ